MSSEAHRPDIRYTTDGTAPKADSAAYQAPLTIKTSAVIKAAVFENGSLRGPVSETHFRSHLALGRAPGLRAAFKPRYAGGGPLGLVDGLLGSRSHTDGRWQGFEADDLDAVIDLGDTRKIGAVTIGFLRNTSSWIFFPRTVEAAVSLDGTTYKPLAAPAAFEAGDDDGAPLRLDIRIEAAGVRARYLRVTAKSIGLCPPGHSGAGGKSLAHGRRDYRRIAIAGACGGRRADPCRRRSRSAAARPGRRSWSGARRRCRR